MSAEGRPNPTARFEPQLTQRRLEEFLREVQGSALAESEELLQMGLEVNIVEHFLGPDWVKRNLLLPDRVKKGTSPLLPFERMAGGDPGAFIARMRLASLARSLLDIKGMPGSAWKFQDARNADAVGVWWEFQVAWAIRKAGVFIGALPNRSGVPGQPIPDYSVQLGDDHIAVEAKSIQPRAVEAFTMSQVSGAVERARSQLPNGLPGLVWLLLPWPMASNAAVLAEAHQQIAQALAQSDRINAVFAWSEHVQYAGGDGGAVLHLQKVIVNKRARLPCDVDRFRGIQIAVDGPWRQGVQNQT